MRVVQHPSNNLVLGAPAEWDQQTLPCGALPATRTTVNGMRYIASFWEPTIEELALLNAGGQVILWVVGDGHPVVALEVEQK